MKKRAGRNKASMVLRVVQCQDHPKTKCDCSFNRDAAGRQAVIMLGRLIDKFEVGDRVRMTLEKIR